MRRDIVAARGHVQFSSSQSPAVAARVPAESPARIPIRLEVTYSVQKPDLLFFLYVNLFSCVFCRRCGRT